MPDTDLYVTMKLYASTRKAIRRIAAETGEQLVQVVDRLVKAEEARVDLTRPAHRTPPPEQGEA